MTPYSTSGFMAHVRACTGPAVLTCALFLSACTSPKLVPIQADAYWSGRMAIQVHKNPPENLSASFELQGSAANGEMVLISPIGTTLAKLQWTPHSAQLEQGHQRMESTSLHELGARLTGTELPIRALFEWLNGHTADAPGWQVDLSQHTQGRITAERQLPAPSTVLKIVLDR